MKLTYVGVSDAVFVPLPSGLEAHCKRHGTCDVPDDVAKSLLEQDTWRKATTKKDGDGS